MKRPCNKCGSTDIKTIGVTASAVAEIRDLKCNSCGHEMFQIIKNYVNLH